MIERISIQTVLPDSFFEVGKAPYSELPYAPDEDDRDYLEALVRQHAERNRLILYTDHLHVRLLGIFPEELGQVKFAFWESTDAKANAEAFALLEADVRDQGFTHLSGPVSFNTFHRYRLRLSEPHWQMFDREPVNPPHYPDWLRQLGYSETMQFESRSVRAADVPTWYDAKQEFIEAVPQLPFRFVAPTPQMWADREQEIYDLVGATFSENPGYNPIPLEEFRLLYNADFAAKLCPYSSIFFEDKASGKLIALNLSMPNYHSLGHARKGTFAEDYPRLKHRTLLIKSIGVHPEFRRQNVMNFLGGYTMQHFRTYYDDAIFCLMREDNPSMTFTMGLPHQRCFYALFEKTL